MPFAWLSDDFYAHPKVLALPKGIRNEAAGLFVRLISRSNRYLTDGRVNDADLDACDARQPVVDALLTVPDGFRSGLLERRRGGLVIHDFGQFSKSRRDVKATRDKRAAAGRLGGVASGRARRDYAASRSEPNASRRLDPRPDTDSVPSYSSSASPPRSTQRASAGAGNGSDEVALLGLAEELTGQPYALPHLEGRLGDMARQQLRRFGLARTSEAWRAVAVAAGELPTIRQIVLGADDALSPVPRLGSGDRRTAEIDAAVDTLRRNAQT